MKYLFAFFLILLPLQSIAAANTTIKGANVKAGNALNMDVGGNLDVASVQNTSDSDAQQFSANIQSNLLQGGKMSGGMNVSTTYKKGEGS